MLSPPKILLVDDRTANLVALEAVLSELDSELLKATSGEQALALAKGRRDVPIYYSNGTHAYVGANLSLGRKIDIEHKFFPILSGGNIFHAWLGESSSDPEALYKLTQRIARHSQIGYFCYTKDLTICGGCNTTSAGLLDVCPVCGAGKVRWWSRITGYYSDVTGWNDGKRQELQDRYRISV